MYDQIPYRIDEVKAKLGPANKPFNLMPNKTSVIDLLSNNHNWGSNPKLIDLECEFPSPEKKPACIIGWSPFSPKTNPAGSANGVFVYTVGSPLLVIGVSPPGITVAAVTLVPLQH